MAKSAVKMNTGFIQALLIVVKTFEKGNINITVILLQFSTSIVLYTSSLARFHTEVTPQTFICSLVQISRILLHNQCYELETSFCATR